MNAGHQDLPSSSSHPAAETDDFQLASKSSTDDDKDTTPDAMNINPDKVGIKHVNLVENPEQLHRTTIWNTTWVDPQVGIAHNHTLGISRDVISKLSSTSAKTLLKFTTVHFNSLHHALSDTQKSINRLTQDVQNVASTVPIIGRLKDFAFSQSKLSEPVHRLEGKFDALDHKLDLLLSLFNNKDGIDVKMREKLQTKCSTDIKVHKEKDPEGGDGKKSIPGPKVTSVI